MIGCYIHDKWPQEPDDLAVEVSLLDKFRFDLGIPIMRAVLLSDVQSYPGPREFETVTAISSPLQAAFRTQNATPSPDYGSIYRYTAA